MTRKIILLWGIILFHFNAESMIPRERAEGIANPEIVDYVVNSLRARILDCEQQIKQILESISAEDIKRYFDSLYILNRPQIIVERRFKNIRQE